MEMAGIEPASLKDRPDILRAQSMLSLLLGSCTHTDKSQPGPASVESRTAPGAQAIQQAFRNEARLQEEGAPGRDPSIADQAARAKSVRLFLALIGSHAALTR